MFLQNLLSLTDIRVTPDDYGATDTPVDSTHDIIGTIIINNVDNDRGRDVDVVSQY